MRASTVKFISTVYDWYEKYKYINHDLKRCLELQLTKQRLGLEITIEHKHDVDLRLLALFFMIATITSAILHVHVRWRVWMALTRGIFRSSAAKLLNCGGTFRSTVAKLWKRSLASKTRTHSQMRMAARLEVMHMQFSISLLLDALEFMGLASLAFFVDFMRAYSDLYRMLILALTGEYSVQVVWMWQWGLVFPAAFVFSGKFVEVWAADSGEADPVPMHA